MQLSIFDFINEDFEVVFQNGAMYAKAPKDSFKVDSVELGDKVIYPGQFVSKLGEKKRSSFEMQEGYKLRYCGKTDKLLLFSVNDTKSDYYYAFAYVDRNTLVIGGKHGVKDIRLQHLDIVG